ncbi:MAG: hypothetical protein IJV39_01025 [Ruminococcus sp.]|nr:hypothetical protein [Ruminococcus sp.]
MFFTTIEDEGLKIQSIFTGIVKQIKGVSNDKSHIRVDGTSIKADAENIKHYFDLINDGTSAEEAFSASMRESSVAAQDFVNSLNATGMKKKVIEQKIKEFEVQRRQAKVATLAENATPADIKKLINEYNSGMKSCGLQQKEYTKAVSQGNAVLGKYLTNVKQGDATFSGYVRSLVRSKLATIGLQAATTLLNTALTMGISYGISLLISQIDDLIHHNEIYLQHSVGNCLIDNLLDSSKAQD